MEESRDRPRTSRKSIRSLKPVKTSWNPLKVRLPAILAIAAVIFAACGSSTSTPTPGAATPGAATPVAATPATGATATAAPAAGKEEYVWIGALSTLPLFQARDFKELYKHAAELGVTARVAGPT